MPRVTSIHALKERLMKDVQGEMGGWVYDTVVGQLQKSAEEVVYSVYKPYIYKRRMYGNGGLIADESFHKDIKNPSNNTVRLEVSDVARRSTQLGDWSNAYLAPLIVMGHLQAEMELPEGGYSIISRDFPYMYEHPRDFISHARNKLREGSAPKLALSIGLRDKGYEVGR